MNSAERHIRLQEAMDRRFYGFNSSRDIEDHISKIKAVADVEQLRDEVFASRENNVVFQNGAAGIWAIDYAPKGKGRFLRHIFMTQAALKTFSPIVGVDCDSFSVVKDGENAEK